LDIERKIVESVKVLKRAYDRGGKEIIVVVDARMDDLKGLGDIGVTGDGGREDVG
jgi:hypothetical protein